MESSLGWWLPEGGKSEVGGHYKRAMVHTFHYKSGNHQYVYKHVQRLVWQIVVEL